MTSPDPTMRGWFCASPAWATLAPPSVSWPRSWSRRATASHVWTNAVTARRAPPERARNDHWTLQRRRRSDLGGRTGTRAGQRARPRGPVPAGRQNVPHPATGREDRYWQPLALDPVLLPVVLQGRQARRLRRISGGHEGITARARADGRAERCGDRAGAVPCPNSRAALPGANRHGYQGP